ncbi:MAG: hypothetical protein ACBZ72_02575 [Candidatus Bathyarchaeia archaeon]|jgi:hypothetical protein
MVNRIDSNRVNNECKKGEAVFYETRFHESVADSTGQELKKKFIEYFQEVSKLDDDRLLVLTAELLMENAIDNYLSALMPNYNDEIGNNELIDIYSKIMFAKSLRFSPPKHFAGADTIRKIRNAFVHYLEVRKFEDLDSAAVKTNKNLLKKMKDNLREFLPNNTKPQSPREDFKSLALYVILGINSYAISIRSINLLVRSDNFLTILWAFLDKQENNVE